MHLRHPMVIGDIDGGCGVGSNPARGLYRLWVPIWRCPYDWAPIPVLQKVSAPNAWVPLWLCPNGCAPKSQCPKCLGAPMAVPQTTVPLRLCPKCSAPRSGFHRFIVVTLTTQWLKFDRLLMKVSPVIDQNFTLLSAEPEAIICKFWKKWYLNFNNDYW